jgi:ABC-type transport system involved in multi-copper enzyme maturation permease subunit
MKFLAVTKKELRTFINSPTYYVIGIVFFLVTFLLLFFAFQFLKFGSGDTTQLFNAVAITLTFILPAITMGAFSKEKGSGTYEYLLTSPLRIRDIILGKFFSYLAVVGVLLILTIPFVLTIGMITPLDFGQVVAQYIGIYFYASALIALGIWVSTNFSSEIPAFLITLIVGLLLIIGGTDFLNIVPFALRDLFQTFSILFHYQSLSNGVFDIKDVSFFIGFILIFLSLAHFAIKSEIVSRRSKDFKNLYINLGAIIVLSMVGVFLFQNVYLKLDLTSDGRYTLTEASKNIVGSIEDTVNIRFYTSSNLPGELQSTQKDVNDLLVEYSRFIPNKVKYERINTSASEEAKDEAQEAGLSEIQFQVSTEDSAQSVIGFFGIVIEYKDKKEVINITNGAEDLEYQITTRIRKVAELPTQKIGILSTNVKHNLTTSYISFNEQVGSLFTFVELPAKDGNLEIPEDINVLLIPGIITDPGEAVVEKIKTFFDDGGSVMVLQDTLEPTQGSETGGTETAFTIAKIFSEYGVEIESEIVYDLVQNNVVGISNGLFQIPVDYPFWILPSESVDDNQITKGAPNLSLIWANPLTIGQAANIKVTPLYTTSPSSNTENKDVLNVALQRNYNEREDDRSITIAASIEKGDSRAIVLGDSDIFSDDILGSLADRDSQDQLVLTFMINSLEWLSREQSISELRGKIRQTIRFTPDAGQTTTLLISSIGIPIASIIALAVARQYIRRRNLLKADTLNI